MSPIRLNINLRPPLAGPNHHQRRPVLAEKEPRFDGQSLRQWIALFGLVLATSGCGVAAKRAPSDSAAAWPPPAQRELLRYQQEIEALEQRLPSSRALTADPDCPRAESLVKRICELSERICALTERHAQEPGAADLCRDARWRCQRSGERLERSCGG